MHGFSIDTSQQRYYIADVLRHLVILRIVQPIGTAAPDYVGANHPIFMAQFTRHIVKIIRHSRHTVDAYKNLGIMRITPLLVSHFVQAGGGQALNSSE